MKRPLLTALIALVASLMLQTAQAQNHKSLPANANSYIAKHFKDCTINHYEKETDFLDVKHKVYVTCNNVPYRLEFDKPGNIIEISSIDERTELPQSVLPVRITQHAKEKFPGAKIVKWEKERGEQTIELDNDVELTYNRKGKFVRMDD